MYVISTLDANVKLTIYFIAYVARWKSRDLWVYFIKARMFVYFCNETCANFIVYQ